MKQMLFCLLLLCSINSFGQSYKIEGDFKFDKKYNFTISRAEVDSRDPIMTEDHEVVTQITVEFEEFEDNIKCIWTYGGTKVVGPGVIDSLVNSEHNVMINIYKGFTIEFLINQQGKYIKLLNYEELKKNIVDGFVKMFNYQRPGIDSASIASVFEIVRPTFENEEVLISTYFGDIPLYFDLFGQSFKKRVEVKSVNTYPNFYNGRLFSIQGKIKIDKKKGELLVLKKTEELIGEDAARIIREHIEMLNRNSYESIKSEEASNSTLNYETFYYYNLDEKMFEKATLKKILRIGKITKTEILKIELMN